jgi:hypothetical protein
MGAIWCYVDATRISLLFDVTTAPTDRGSARAHSGGWSEGHWLAGIVTSNSPKITALAQKRALLLPSQATIIGFRIATYSINGNKMFPLGTSVGKFSYPGTPGRPTDLPQCALGFSCTMQGAPNSVRFNARCIPDLQLQFGEYQPDENYKRFVTQFGTALTSNAYGSIVRNLAAPSARVLNAAAGNIALFSNIGGVKNQDYLRLNRVKTDTGENLSGSFLITDINDIVYTLQGLGNKVITRSNGSARLDQIQFVNYATVNPSRAEVRKVGRSFEQYRGRASRR